MAFPVVTFDLVEKVSVVAQNLLDSQHNGFPILKTVNGKRVFYGLIIRKELLVILENPDVLNANKVKPMDDTDLDIAPIGYEKMLAGPKVMDPKAISKFLEELVDPQSKYHDYYIDLTPYANQSATTVPLKFSLHRAYTLISALGLRHLTVVNDENQVQGIITRKDLMGFNMVDVLSGIMQNRPYFQNYGEEATDSHNAHGASGHSGGRGRGGEVADKEIESDVDESPHPTRYVELDSVA